MVKFNDYREQFMNEIYVGILLQALDFNNFEISSLVFILLFNINIFLFNIFLKNNKSLYVLSTLSSTLEFQNKLIELGVLHIMCSLLKESKDIKLRR